jgi:hypothetical protein
LWSLARGIGTSKAHKVSSTCWWCGRWCTVLRFVIAQGFPELVEGGVLHHQPQVALLCNLAGFSAVNCVLGIEFGGSLRT